MYFLCCNKEMLQVKYLLPWHLQLNFRPSRQSGRISTASNAKLVMTRDGSAYVVVGNSSRCTIHVPLPTMPRFLIKVKVCTSVIPDHEFQRYINLWNRTKKRKTELTMVRMTITEDKEDKLASSTDRLLEARNKKPKVSTEMRRYYDTVGGSKSNHLPSGQTPIDTAFDTLKQSDLARMNDARMHMAIATFFHENNLPDRAVNSSSFKIMIKYA